MATIEPYQTKAGKRWRVRYRKPDRRQTDKRGFTTKRDAQLFAATVETAKATGTYIDPTAGNITINELGEAWLRAQFHLRGSSMNVYRNVWHKHISPRFGTTPVSRITTGSIRAWITDLSHTYGASTVQRAHGVLARILDTAVESERIPTNPARRIRRLPAPRPRKNVYLTYQQVEAAAAHAGKYKLAVYLAAYVGLRLGEIQGLEAGDIDLDRRRIRVERSIGRQGEVYPTKTGKPREIGFPSFLTPMLAQASLESGGGRLLPSLPLPRKLGWFGTMKRNAGLPERFVYHDFRHAAASFAISSGAHVKVVQNMLGHASAKETLDTYSDLFDSDVNQVADRIDAVRAENMGTMWAEGGF